MSSGSEVSIQQKRYLNPRQNFYRRVLRRKRKRVYRKRNIDRNKCNRNRLWRRLIEMIIKIILILLSMARRYIFIS